MDYYLIFQQLDNWAKVHEYKSYDLCDVTSQPIYLKLSTVKNKMIGGNYVTYPFFYLAKKKSNKLRKIFNIEPQKYPQAQSIIARAYLKMYHTIDDQIYFEEAKALLEWLRQVRNPEYSHSGWGQPYDWYSGKVIPANTPRTTVTSQVSHAFLDMYETTNDDQYLQVAIDTCHFYLNEMNWDTDVDGDICFPYTTRDTYHIHNANILAASVLIRTWNYCGEETFLEYGIKSLQFTVKHQNEDGSWYYWAPPDPIKGKIDNYHTGFVLESISVIKRYLGSRFSNDDTYERGVRYYISQFFKDGIIPQMTPDNVYPIDIQSCAQSIITLSEINSEFPETIEQMTRVCDWTIENMYDPEGYFYYRIYTDGTVDKNQYIRWGESWMLRALSVLISLVEK